MTITPEQIESAHAIYTRRNLSFYDLVVLGLSNRFIWRCPTPRLLAHYNQHVTANHLDVGVGTGYFLHRCQFATPTPRIALMDLNPVSLAYAAERTARYQPETYRQNVLDPITARIANFDSVGINYLLHCLPGSLTMKAVVFDHLQAVMNPGATVFGSTLLQGGVVKSSLAQGLMNVYNQKGIFSNQADCLAGIGASVAEPVLRSED